MGADGHVLTVPIDEIPPAFEKFLGEPYRFVNLVYNAVDWKVWI